VHPWGGRLLAPDSPALAEAARAAGLVRQGDGWTLPGDPPGAGSWTHEDADPGRSCNSHDALVRPPFAPLWFGASSPFAESYKAKARPPRPQVAGGRCLSLGPGVLAARDLYTGRVLWTCAVPRMELAAGLGAGARLSGGHLASFPDAVFLHAGAQVLRIDAATGAIQGSWPVSGAAPGWYGLLLATERVVIAGEDFTGSAEYPPAGRTAADDDDRAGAIGLQVAPRARRLVAFDRVGGRRLWQLDARAGFLHNAVALGGGRLYACDRGAGDAAGRLLAVDLASGAVRWERPDGFGSLLLHHARLDLLVEKIDSGPRNGSVWRRPEDRIRVWNADGSLRWEAAAPPRNRPYLLVGDELFPGNTLMSPDDAGLRFDLASGATRPGPLLRREMGRVCSGFLACEHLLTLRNANAAFARLQEGAVAEPLSGFRPGCTENLIPAGGVLAAPAEYASGCSCGYPVQTSLALIHDPEATE
jgi:outer membrane protein assembly factor BamB